MQIGDTRHGASYYQLNRRVPNGTHDGEKTRGSTPSYSIGLSSMVEVRFLEARPFILFRAIFCSMNVYISYKQAVCTSLYFISIFIIYLNFMILKKEKNVYREIVGICVIICCNLSI